MNEYEEVNPCDECTQYDYCDSWEAQFCCTRFKYIYDGDTPCDNCDPMDI